MPLSSSLDADASQSIEALRARNAELERQVIVEAALERVRSRALAMRRSEDLPAAVATVFDELEQLGLTTLRCGFGIVDPESRRVEIWSTTSTDEGRAVQVVGDEVLEGHPLLEGIFEAWTRQEDLAYVLEGDDLVRYYETVSQTNFQLPDTRATSAFPAGTRQYYHSVFFPQGGLYAFRDAPFSEEVIQVMRRMADVLYLAYARYDDFRRLEARKREVEAALGELKATQQQLIQAEKMASLGQLTAGIAHEIKNPLNFVNNFSEIVAELSDELQNLLDPHLDASLQDEADDVRMILADLSVNAEQIVKHGKRADGIVRAMMQHARGGSGGRERTDLNAFVTEYVHLAYHGKRAQMDGFNATIEETYDDSVGAVMLEPQEIGRVLLNLLGNAFDAGEERRGKGEEGYEPTVAVSTRRVGEAVEIRIADNGPGIPQHLREKIFEPFFTTKPTGSGTGLGLSLSYDIVTQGHGGRLALEETPGDGATFVVTLPASDAP